MTKTEPPTDLADGEGGLAQEIARIESIINSPAMRDLRGRGSNRAIQPRNAASILLVEGKGGNARILMGRRNRSLAFMPGALVFPGGAVDRSDSLVCATDGLHPAVERKITDHMRGRPTGRRAQGLGMAALRELCEESGLLLGRPGETTTRSQGWKTFRRHGVTPSLGGLRLLARAITPPGPPRRFDTWFFVASADEIAFRPDGGFLPSGELEELRWIAPAQAVGDDTHEITKVMLVELMNRLKRDPDLDPAYPAPFYRVVGKRFHRDTM